MRRFVVIQIIVAAGMFINWQVFPSNFSLWSFGFVSGMACVALLRDIILHD